MDGSSGFLLHGNGEPWEALRSDWVPVFSIIYDSKPFFFFATSVNLT